jgi:serine-type D-Ala-D-Ala carboxypeptidase
MEGGRTAVAQLLGAAVRAGLAPGAVAAWVRVGESAPSAAATGTADLGPPPAPATADTVFDLASLTKPLATATLVLLARRGGRLDLDTRVGRLLPELAARPLGERSVLDLLTHGSGLPAWAPLYALCRGRRERLAAVLGELPLAPAGRQVVYSCPGFITLGLALETLHGRPLDRLFAEAVAAPLGLGLGFGPRPGDRIAAGATAPGAERRLVAERGLDETWIPATGPGLPDDGNARFLGGAAGNAGLFGRVLEVLALASVYLPGGGLLTDEERALATGNHTSGLGQARGLGWQLASSPGCSAGASLAPEAFGHTGFTGTSLWVDPTRRLIAVLLTNRTHPGHREVDLHPLRRRFHDLLVQP